MRDGTRFALLWAGVFFAAWLAAATLGRYGLGVLALGFLYALLATSWSWLRASGLFSFGHAAFFGVGALAQAGLVTSGRISPWAALAASAAAGALASLPLIPALRLRPASFALATLAYAVLLKGLAATFPALGAEGFLLPASPGLTGAAPAAVAVLGLLALVSSLGYETFLRRPGGRAAAAIRQSPETTSSLGIDIVGERWRPLTLSAAAAALGGAFYAHLTGSVESAVVFSPSFSVLPLVFGMLGGALHPLGGIVGTLVLYPLDELLFRPALPHAHMLAYGGALVGLLMIRPEGLLRARIPAIPSARPARLRRPEPLSLAVRGLTVRRGGVPALRDVSFRVEPGEIFWVLGPNGAGKTSLLLAIAGKLPVAHGQILFGGHPAPRGAAARARRGVGRSFQAPRPFPEWTVRENVALASERAGRPEEVDSLLSELQLDNLRDRPAGRLSVGEGKRLELARVLATSPSLLLLDEPLAGLSPDAAGRVSGLIDRARRRGAAVLWVEHGPAAGELASQLLVLEGGQVRFRGSLAEWEAARREPLP
jgi:ABC-type multidrug transport system ATPase subunit/ABC-type branched-subunit amino acid transport system permease subunit